MYNVGPYRSVNNVGPYRSVNNVGPYRSVNNVGPYRSVNNVGPYRSVFRQIKLGLRRIGNIFVTIFVGVENVQPYSNATIDTPDAWEKAS